LAGGAAGPIAIGLNIRKDSAVLATTRSDDGADANAVLILLSAFVILARFRGAGPSSPSVPSSYPEVFPPFCAAAFGLRALGLLTEALEEGRDTGFTFPAVDVLTVFELSALIVWLNGSVTGCCCILGLRS